MISGDYPAKAPIVATKIVLANGAHLHCTPGTKLELRAAQTLEISGTVAIDCDGARGADGGAGHSYTGFCVGNDHRNAEDDFNRGGNEVGGNGDNGTNGGDAEDVALTAGAFVFDPGAVLVIHAQGGAGGAGGAAGRGNHKALAKSGDDCKNGTNFIRTPPHAPDGHPGNPGNPGRDGKVTAKGATRGVPNVQITPPSKDVPAAWQPKPKH